MAKQIIFTYKDTEYTLEFTRASIQKLEARDFDITEVKSKPMTYLPLIFAGAFLAHHPYIKKELVDEIFDKFKDKAGLFDKLAEMYNEPIEAMLETEGNLEWKATW